MLVIENESFVSHTNRSAVTSAGVRTNDTADVTVGKFLI
jgi:hypothetical protein